MQPLYLVSSVPTFLRSFVSFLLPAHGDGAISGTALCTQKAAIQGLWWADVLSSEPQEGLTATQKVRCCHGFHCCFTHVSAGFNAFPSLPGHGASHSRAPARFESGHSDANEGCCASGPRGAGSIESVVAVGELFRERESNGFAAAGEKGQ